MPDVTPTTDTRYDLRSLLTRASFYPFTVTTCALITFVGFLTLTATGQAITHRALLEFGWAPRDLLALDLGRTAFSALVTSGGAVFWMALALTALFVGAAEHYGGTAIAAATFWGVHLATTALMLAVALPLHLAGISLATLVFVTRDVGPSAGYVGCLGLALVLCGKPWRWWALGATGAALGAVLAMSLATLGTDPTDVSANFAHAVALPLGALAGLAVVRWRRAR